MTPMIAAVAKLPNKMLEFKSQTCLISNLLNKKRKKAYLLEIMFIHA